MCEAMSPGSHLALFEWLTLAAVVVSLLFQAGLAYCQRRTERKSTLTVLRKTAALYSAALWILDRGAGVKNDKHMARLCSAIDLAPWDSNLSRIHLLTSVEVEDFITIYWALHKLVNSARDCSAAPQSTDFLESLWPPTELREHALKTRTLLRDYLDGLSGKDLVWGRESEEKTAP